VLKEGFVYRRSSVMQGGGRERERHGRGQNAEGETGEKRGEEKGDGERERKEKNEAIKKKLTIGGRVAA
jgi:hypothetical protein